MFSRTHTNRRRTGIRTVLAATAVLVGAAGLVAPAAANAAPVTKTFVVDAKTAGAEGVFADSGVVVAAGAPVTVTATGEANYDPSLALVGPNGTPGNICGAAGSPCAIEGQNYVALIGKVGTADPVLVGEGPTTLSGSGPLTFAINDNIDGYFNNSGSFTVTITYTPACKGLFCFGS